MARPASAPRRNGDVSFWWSDIGLDAPRPALRGGVDADVVVVGGGYTGLWTAYYLALARPSWRVVVLEQRFVGYGASGRNGGWLTSALAGHRGRMARRHGRDAVLALQHEMSASVDEVVERAQTEGIDADIDKGGCLQVARNPAQLDRLVEQAAQDRAWGDPDVLTLDARGSQALVRVAGALGGSFSPHTARLHPAKLVRGLAQAAERAGVSIYEQSAVRDASPGQVRTDDGVVRAPVVLRCTEGFTAALPGLRRRLLPMNSSLLVTDPLPEAVWDEVGWPGGLVLGDHAHAYMYAQRTADGRIALGGRGVPYRFGSRTDTDGSTGAATVAQLHETLVSMFPAVRDVGLAHVWSGVLGVPRDWCASITFDADAGVGWAGGYTGHGVTTANLAGRTLRDLVLGEHTALTRLPHVGWRSPSWEPEPARWLGVQAMYAAYRAADRHESASSSPRSALLARVADRVSGR